MIDPMKHIIKPYGTASDSLILGGNQGGKKSLVCFLFHTLDKFLDIALFEFQVQQEAVDY